LAILVFSFGIDKKKAAIMLRSAVMAGRRLQMNQLQRAVDPSPIFRMPTACYHDDLIDHYENPRNVGRLDKKDTDVGTGLVGAPACGDVMQLQIRVNGDGVISETKFKTFGCGSAIASSSVATEWLKGKTLDEAGGITNKQIASELKLPPVKLHCR
jgi:nitrogen fixation NifU-like protein